jgi:hypothetical protein
VFFLKKKLKIFFFIKDFFFFLEKHSKFFDAIPPSLQVFQ